MHSEPERWRRWIVGEGEVIARSRTAGKMGSSSSSSLKRVEEALERVLARGVVLRRFLAELLVGALLSVGEGGASGSSVSQPLSSMERERRRGGLAMPEEP